MISSSAFPSIPLHKTAGGRLFVRKTAEGRRTLVFGLVDFPREVATEALASARLNTHLWVDVYHHLSLESITAYPEDLYEADIASVLTTLRFQSYLLPDEIDVFLRKSVLPHADENRQWAVVAGVAQGRLQACPVDGLYELEKSGLRFTGIAQSEKRFLGTNPSMIFHMPLWGPSGRYGVSTTMEPQAYSKWLVANRTRTAGRDPQFERYLELMKERGAEVPPLYYTAEELEARELLAKEVVAQMMAEEYEQPLRNRTRPELP